MYAGVCVVVQLLLKAGGEGKHTVFLFADSQIKDESFMEDISMILNTGDVPNLYAADEKAEIIEKMQGMARKEVACQAAGVRPSPSAAVFLLSPSVRHPRTLSFQP